MKKVLFVFCLFLIGLNIDLSAQITLNVKVDKEIVESPDFNGIWQLAFIVGSDDDEIKAKPMPHFKMYGKDQSFRIVTSFKGLFVIATEGSYYVNDEKSYTESIVKSSSDAILNNKENVLEYKFINKDAMLVTFSMPNNPRKGKELWLRVKMPMDNPLSNSL